MEQYVKRDSASPNTSAILACMPTTLRSSEAGTDSGPEMLRTSEVGTDSGPEMFIDAHCDSLCPSRHSHRQAPIRDPRRFALQRQSLIRDPRRLLTRTATLCVRRGTCIARKAVYSAMLVCLPMLHMQPLIQHQRRLSTRIAIRCVRHAHASQENPLTRRCRCVCVCVCVKI